MDHTTDCFVSGALAVVLRVSRLAGVAPLRFVPNKNGWRASLSAGWSLYGYCIVIVFNAITIATVASELQLEPGRSVRMRSRTRRAVWILHSTLLMAIAGTAVYGAPAHMRFLMSCINRVQKINRDLNIHHWPMFSEKKKICLFFLWAMACVTLTCADHGLLMHTVDVIDADKWICLMYWFYYGSYWIAQLRLMLVIMITLHAMQVYRALNNNLKALLSDGGPRAPAPAGSLRRHATVRLLSAAYGGACDVVRDVDRRNGPTALMMLGLLLLHLLVSAYYFVNNIPFTEGVIINATLVSTVEDSMARSEGMHVTNVLMQLFWCMFHLLNLVMLIEPCHLTHMEMEATRELVSKLMMHCSDSNHELMVQALELFYRHLLLNQPSYSPLKVTTMSRSLVAAILSAITTYLVVIIQF